MSIQARQVCFLENGLLILRQHDGADLNRVQIGAVILWGERVNLLLAFYMICMLY